jgi:osmotically-inducible protein OsmY
MRNWYVQISPMIGMATLFAMLMAFTACSTTRTVGEQVDDGWIKTKVISKYTADPEINPFNIGVQVVDGVVTLSGIVPRADVRSEAEKLARETEGVRQVRNELQVGPKKTGL